MQTFNVGKEFKRYMETIANIQIIKFEKRELEIEVEDCMPNCIQTLCDMPRGNTTSDSTANTAAQIEGLMINIRNNEREIEREQRKITIIDMLIQTLKQEDQELVTKRIKEKKNWETMQVELYDRYKTYTHYKSVERRYKDIS